MSELFPRADHFVLGAPFGQVPTGRGAPTAWRPFGLTTSALPRTVIDLPLDAITYDEIRQIALVHSPSGAIPLAKHTDGVTNTQTNVDGQRGPDSDTDHRED